jgi:hypothetical protein
MKGSEIELEGYHPSLTKEKFLLDSSGTASEFGLDELSSLVK